MPSLFYCLYLLMLFIHCVIMFTMTMIALAGAANDGRGIDALIFIIVCQRRLDGFLCQYRAVHLDRGQTVEGLHDGGIGQFHRVLHALSLDHLRCHARRRDSSAAAKGFKLDVFDDIIFNFHINLHDIAALEVADLADCIGIGLSLIHI